MFNSQNPCIKLSMVVYACNTSTGKVETDPWDSVTSGIGCLVVQTRERFCLKRKKKKVIALETNTQGWPLTTAYASVHQHTLTLNPHTLRESRRWLHASWAWTASFQSCKNISLLFKPPRLCPFVPSVRENEYMLLSAVRILHISPLLLTSPLLV